MTTRKISESTVRRLSKYLRYLRDLRRLDRVLVSSSELANGTGTTAAQVRKDLSFFGSFGQRGRGYPVEELFGGLTDILGLSRQWNVALVGVGKIGSALLGSGTLASQGFRICAAFDADPDKTGLTVFGLEVLPMESLERVIEALGIDLGIIATTPETAHDVAARLEIAGVSGILSFVPNVVGAPDGIPVRTMDVAVELEGLSFLVASGQARKARESDPDRRRKGIA